MYQKIKNIIGLAILTVSLVQTATFFIGESSSLEGMKLTQGTVIALGDGITHRQTVNGKATVVNVQPLVDFKIDNVTYRSEGKGIGLWFPKWVIGQKVGIYFSPSDPTISVINRFDEIYPRTYISSLASVAILLFLGAALIFSKAFSQKKTEHSGNASQRSV